MKKSYFINNNNRKNRVVIKSGKEKHVQYCHFIIFFCWFQISLYACGPFLDSRKDISIDLSPPVLNEIKTELNGAVVTVFDEPVTILESSVSIDPPLFIENIYQEKNKISFMLADQIPGNKYSLSATCEDEHENSLYFIATFYGFNPHIPKIFINEFITQGSKTHPDLIEFKVIESGNMGGLVCYQGTYHNWDNRFVFPCFIVQDGDFVLLHFKPQGIEGEIDEIEGKDISIGLDAFPLAYDFWVKDGTGLSGNNGVITLYENPGGRLVDGILYSNRTSESDENYMGFGTKKVMERALELASSGGWEYEAEQIRPEDGINPDNSTATRSICRNNNGTDTDKKDDWHIVPTRKSSFGEENTDETYE